MAWAGPGFSRWKRSELTLFGRSALLVLCEILANALLWVAAAIVFGRTSKRILSFALIAWTLGLRHGLDADHICAIDNATRKFISQGRQPVTTGLYFSLGHSTVVLAVGIAIAISSAVADRLDGVGTVGGVIGTSISASFLLLLAMINGWILYRALRAQKNPGSPHPFGGCLFRLTKPVFKLIDAPWKLYPIGTMFGFGFDTASEIALLGVSAEAGGDQSPPAGSVILLPLLFTAGMTLVDSLDSIGMLWSYAMPDPVESGWRGKRIFQTATVESLVEANEADDNHDEKADEKVGEELPHPPRSHTMATLSIALTIISITMAFCISFIEFMGLAAAECSTCAQAADNNPGLEGRWWRFWIAANENSGYIGAGIVGTLSSIVVMWLVWKRARKHETICHAFGAVHRSFP